MKDHIRTVEYKIAKNLGLLYRDKQLLSASPLKSIYVSCIQRSFIELILKAKIQLSKQSFSKISYTSKLFYMSNMKYSTSVRGPK